MEHRQAIAFAIALQTHVLQTCPVHNEVFYDDDVDPSSAFALALELVRRHKPYVHEFEDDAQSSVEIEQVGKRQLFALEDFGRTQCSRRSRRTVSRSVPGRALMRIFTVPEIADFVQREIQHVRQQRCGHLVPLE